MAVRTLFLRASWLLAVPAVAAAVTLAYRGAALWPIAAIGLGLWLCYAAIRWRCFVGAAKRGTLLREVAFTFALILIPAALLYLGAHVLAPYL